MLRDLDLSLRDVLRWLDLGRDVVIRGDDGSGRTTVLRAVQADAEHRGIAVVLLRAAGPARFAALLAHPACPPAIDDSTTQLAQWLTGQLEGERALLLIDDVLALDEGTAAVVHQALAHTGAGLVVTGGGSRARAHSSELVASIVAERAPADVRVRPLGFTSLARLLSAVLGAPADVSFTAAVAARSAGNPRVAVALADAARFAGVIEHHEDHWATVSTLDQVPMESVINAVLPRLPAEEVAALEVLAWTGPVPASEATKIVGAQALTGLADRGRVLTAADQAGVERVALSPPALADALRASLSRQRRLGISEQVAAIVGSERFAHIDEHWEVDLILAPRADDSDRSAKWTAGLAALLYEHGTAQETVLRQAWLLDPTVATANDYLAVLMRRPAREQLAEVFGATPMRVMDDPLGRSLYRMNQMRWAVWRGMPEAELDALEHQYEDDLRPMRELTALRDQVLERARAGEELEPELAEREPQIPGELGELALVTLVGVLLEVGRPELALTLAERGDLRRAHHPAGDLLAGLRAEALLLLGEVEEVERTSRGLLTQACEDMNSTGVRVHGCMLAQALAISGRNAEAWRVLATVLRLGSSGPADDPFHRRALAVGAALRSRLGDLALAEDLLSELRRIKVRYRPMLDSLLPLAEVAVSQARGGEDTGCDEALWEEGERLAEQGQYSTALVCWLLRPRPYDPERMAVISEAFARSPLPLLAPWVRLHQELSNPTAGALAAAIGSVPEGVPLVRTAVEVLRTLPGGEELAPSLAEQGSRRLWPTVLTEQERAVAALAWVGLSNREIAAKLFLSVRTAEHYLDHVLRKLGLNSRAELERLDSR